MRSALDVPGDGFNDYEKNFVSKIREYGWFRTSVIADGDNLGFSYSTGFWTSANHPEMLVFSIDGQVAYDVFADIYDAAKAGEQFPVNQRIKSIFNSFDAVLAPVSKKYYPDYILSSRWFYGGEDFPCLQLIWPDPAGRFPWELGADARFANSQPDLSPNGWESLEA